MSEVARQLNLTTAAISAAVKRLELSLGVSLFERTTRSLRLSPAGEAFIPHLQQVLGALDQAEYELRNLQTQISGDISLGLPSDLGRHYLIPILDAFQLQHPEVKLIIHLSDYLQDLYREGLDVVIRYGEQQDSGLIGKKLVDNNRLLVASPAYIQAHPPVRKLQDLVDHNCLLFYRNDRPYSKWVFEVEGREEIVQVTGDRYADDGELVKRWAIAGRGIAYKSRLDVQQELADGSLVALLPGQYKGQATPVYAVYKERKYQAYRITALLAYLQEELTKA